MKKTKIFAILAIIPGIFTLVAVFFVLFLFLIKFLWAWTIPDLFPGAVEQNLIVSELTWWTAFKLALFLSIFTSAVRKKDD